ncbi:MAG: hypothetical protein Q9191_006523 [Dirinaria sp. TL-2023a]
MALIQTTLIWVVYAVVLALLFAVASIFIYLYQTPREKSYIVSAVCIFTLTSLLATVLLLPVDVALVSSTTSSKLGRRKDWASQDRVDNIRLTLKIVYYTLFSLDTILCLLVVPFTYFWYEEYDEIATEEGNQTITARLWGAFKYTIAFVFLVVVIVLVGYFVPNARDRHGAHYDYHYFKELLRANSTLIYILYAGAGLALLPVAMIKQAPSISAPTLSANTASALAENRERQRQLEGRNEGREGGLPPKDRRELDALVREERTLVRRERLAAEASGEGHNWLVRAWMKIEAVFRPLKLLGGLFLMLVAVLVWVSMLITGIDKAMNSVCKTHCGYVLAHTNIFNPLNWVFVKSAKVFPIDYVLFMLLVLLFFSSSVVGVATIGIRFLWLRIFQIRKGHTTPQALLMATVLLTLIALAVNYAIAMLVAPQYAHWGPQTYCNQDFIPGEQPDCTHNKNAIRPCTEKSHTRAAQAVCTPSVISAFLDRITVGFSFFGVVDFWAQFAFLAVYLIVFTLTLFRTPRLDTYQLEQDAEEDEEEGLLASTGRRFGATWQDITVVVHAVQSRPLRKKYGKVMGDDAENEDAALLSRLNALKKSSVSLRRDNYPLVSDGQKSDLSDRFQKLGNGDVGRSLRQPEDFQSYRDFTREDGGSNPPSPTLEELLAELNTEEEQHQLHPDELADAEHLLAEAKRALASDEDIASPVAKNEAFKAEGIDQSENKEEANDRVEADEEADAAAALQRILDEECVEESLPSTNDSGTQSATPDIERNINSSSVVHEEVVVVVENLEEHDTPFSFPKAPTTHLSDSPRTSIDDIFPPAPTAAPRAAAPPAAAARKKQNHPTFTDAEIDSWCIICLADATVRCLGCAGDLYCNVCWKEGHTGLDAGYEERRHKAIGLRRNNAVGST